MLVQESTDKEIIRAIGAFVDVWLGRSAGTSLQTRLNLGLALVQIV